MQPHIPFLGLDYDTKGFGHLLDELGGGNVDDFWGITAQNQFSKEEIFEPYRENLKLALDVVKDLEEVLSGRTIITSDHGNLIGEKGLYGHPRRQNYQCLKKFPLR